MLDLSKETKFVRLNNAVAAGQTTVTTSIFNNQGQATAGQWAPPTTGTLATSTVPTGFDAICIVVALNTVVAGGVLTVTLQDNSLNQTGGMANVSATIAQVSGSTNGATVQNSTYAGLQVTDTGGLTSNGLVLLDVALSQLQYYQVVITRATANIALDGVFGVLYRSKQRPVVQDATVVGQGYFVASS
jgi:hypothetical protein